MASRFHTAFYKLLPPWLTEGESELVAGTINLLIDASVERSLQGLNARFPTRTGVSGLDLIGKDRLIPRGRDEPSANFIERIIGWRYPRGHRIRGSAFALLEQVWNYFGGIDCRTNDVNGTEHDRTVDGTESYFYGVDFNWDADLTRRYRFWLMLFPVPTMPNVARWTAVTSAWGGRIGPQGRQFTVGQQGITPDDCRAMRRLLRRGPHAAPWKPAGTSTDYAVVSLSDVHSSPDPEGNWGTAFGRITTSDRSVIRFWRMNGPP